MSFLIRQCIATLAILLIILVPLSSGQLLAQEPPTFEISVIPQAEFATAAQPFTYTVTITNVGQSSLNNIIVKMPVPEGSGLINTYFDNPDWLVGGAQRGETGDVIWLTQEPVAPNQIMTFEMVVNVHSDTGEQLVIENYAVVSADNQEVLASGPPVTTEVLAAPATPPPSSPTPTVTSVSPTPVATSTPTPVPDTDSEPSTEVAATSEAQPEQIPTDVPVSSPPQGEASETGSPLLIGILAIIGVAILVLIIVGLVRWFNSS